jgi:hypothetical protein
MQQKFSSQTKVLFDAAAHSEHGVLIRCEIGPKTVERSGNEWYNMLLFIDK